METEQETSVEQAEASPATETPSEQEAAQETPETPSSETAAEVKAEEPTELDAETQKQLSDFDKFLADELGAKEETPEAPTDEKVTFTKKDLEALLFRERQSAADRTERKLRDEQEQRARAMQGRAQAEAQMNGRIRERLQGYVNRAEEIPATFADDVLAEGRQTYYGEGWNSASVEFARAAYGAWQALPGAQDAPPEVVEPLNRQARTAGDVMTAVAEVAHALGKRAAEAEVEKRIERESDKKAEVKASVLMKKFLAQQRANSPNGELPAGTAPAGKITEAELKAHEGDDAWWEANRERYFAQQGLKRK